MHLIADLKIYPDSYLETKQKADHQIMRFIKVVFDTRNTTFPSLLNLIPRH